MRLPLVHVTVHVGNYMYQYPSVAKLATWLPAYVLDTGKSYLACGDI